MAPTQPPAPYWTFARFALASLLPFALFGVVLVMQHRVQGERRALAEASARAALVEAAVIQPSTASSPLDARVVERTLTRVGRSVSVLHLRVWDPSSTLVAAAGAPGTRPLSERSLARALAGDEASVHSSIDGVDALAVYRPLVVGGTTIGVLELAVPWAPFGSGVQNDALWVAVVVAGGLIVIWLALAGLAVLSERRLRREAARVRELSDRDLLTGLPNRAVFGQAVEQAIVAADGTGDRVAIALLDLDNFKEVNDAYGHERGDALLQLVAKRLTASLPAGAVVARLGGDEFGIVLVKPDQDLAVVALEHVRAGVLENATVDGQEIGVEASVGVSFWPADADDRESLLLYAEQALHEAKRTGRGIVRWTRGLKTDAHGRSRIIAQLRHAIGHGQLVLHFQPRVAFADDGALSAEALVRWDHPGQGRLLGPGEFLPVAEETGLIRELTLWVIDNAIRHLRAWTEEWPDLALSVNVSARNLADRDLPDRILELLARHDVQPRRLLVEVTETAVTADPDAALHVLTRLRAAGIHVSLDDFGQGNTSLGQLPRLPIDELKIDRSFVTGVASGRRDRAVVRHIVELAHDLGLSTVAEGVESEEVLQVLHRLGCDAAQGYHLARPLPALELIEWLRARRGRALPLSA